MNMDTSSSDLPFPVTMAGNQRTRPIKLESYVSDDQANRLLRGVEVYNLSEPTRSLIEHLVTLKPIERFYHALKVMMFRLLESGGTAPSPCLAAEEQVCLEEIALSDLPTESKATAKALLFIPERTLQVRAIRRLTTELTG